MDKLRVLLFPIDEHGTAYSIGKKCYLLYHAYDFGFLTWEEFSRIIFNVVDWWKRKGEYRTDRPPGDTKLSEKRAALQNLSDSKVLDQLSDFAYAFELEIKEPERPVGLDESPELQQEYKRDVDSYERQSQWFTFLRHGYGGSHVGDFIRWAASGSLEAKEKEEMRRLEQRWKLEREASRMI